MCRYCIALPYIMMIAAIHFKFFNTLVYEFKSQTDHFQKKISCFIHYIINYYLCSVKLVFYDYYKLVIHENQKEKNHSFEI